MRINPQKPSIQSKVDILTNIRSYKYVVLWKNESYKKFYIHRLVAETFIKNKDKNKMYVDHINRIRDDNRVENLRWVTYSENNKNRKSWKK